MPADFCIALMLIPLCSILNHLGGQSTEIPDPRIVCRVFLIPLCFALAAIMMPVPMDTAVMLLILSISGLGNWAIWHWGDGFMCITGEDHRDYTKLPWLPHLTDMLMGTNPLSRLTPSQCRNWGTIYLTIRGGFMYPLFIGLGFLLHPIAFVAGAGCFLQGIIYRLARTVYLGEFIYGALAIGAAFAGILIANQVNW